MNSFSTNNRKWYVLTRTEHLGCFNPITVALHIEEEVDLEMDFSIPFHVKQEDRRTIVYASSLKDIYKQLEEWKDNIRNTIYRSDSTGEKICDTYSKVMKKVREMYWNE